MNNKFKFDGNEYDIDKLSKTGKDIYKKLRDIDLTVSEKKNLLAFLFRAKRAYMSDLKSEVLSQKAGFDFSD